MATKITYDGITLANLESGQTAVIRCSDKKAVSDIVVTFGGDGYITYHKVKTSINRGQTATLTCADKKMTSDVVVSVYGAEPIPKLKKPTIYIETIADDVEMLKLDAPIISLDIIADDVEPPEVVIPTPDAPVVSIMTRDGRDLVTWSAVDGADKYHIYYLTNAGKWRFIEYVGSSYPLDNIPSVYVPSGATTSIYVVAIDTANNLESKPSNTVSYTKPIPKLNTPKIRIESDEDDSNSNTGTVYVTCVDPNSVEPDSVVEIDSYKYTNIPNGITWRELLTNYDQHPDGMHLWIDDTDTEDMIYSGSMCDVVDSMEFDMENGEVLFGNRVMPDDIVILGNTYIALGN